MIKKWNANIPQDPGAYSQIYLDDYFGKKFSITKYFIKTKKTFYGYGSGTGFIPTKITTVFK